MLDRNTEFLPSWMQGFKYPYHYKVVNFEKDENYIILRVKHHPDGRITCSEVHKKKIIDDLVNYLTRHAVGEYLMDHAQATRAINVWLARTDKLTKMPKIISFKSEPELALCKLPFDPVKSMTTWQAAAPTFAKIMERMTNSEAFMLRIASIFDPNASRKQSIWLSGEKDSGKSQIDKIIRYICGYEKDNANTGGYASLGSRDTESAFWKQALVGKRVVSVHEARPEFLNKDEFLSITGDDVHNINPKGSAFFSAQINCLLFFYSNQAPLIDNKGEIMERVIHCHIEPVAREDMIPEHILFQQLKNELPYFLGACLDMYKVICPNGERIPNEKTTLEAASMEHEGWALDIFTDYFVKAENHELPAGRVRQLLVDKPKLKEHEIRKLIRIWNNYYGVIQTRDKHQRYWKGLNWKSSGSV